MKLHRTGEAAYDWDATVFRAGRWLNSLIGVIFAIAFAVPGLLYFFGGAKIPLLIVVPCTMLAVFIGKWMMSMIISLWLSSNWTLAVQPDGVWLNLRSCFNHRFEEAQTLLHLPYEDIVSVRRCGRLVSASMQGDAKYKQTSLELTLAESVDAQQIKSAIAEENRRRTPAQGILIKSTSRIQHTPVSIVEMRKLRIPWNGPMSGLTPNINTAIRMLSQYVTVDEAAEIQKVDWQELSDEAFDDTILETLIQGQSMEAIRLLRNRKGMSLRDARAFVKELQDQQTLNTNANTLKNDNNARIDFHKR